MNTGSHNPAPRPAIVVEAAEGVPRVQQPLAQYILMPNPSKRYKFALLAGWLAHPWVNARDRAVDTAPGHRASARCDQAASVGLSWRL